MTRRDAVVNMLWCVPGAVGGSEEYLVRQLLGLAETGRWCPRVMGARGLGAAHADMSRALDVEEPPFDSTRRWRRVVGEATWLHTRSTGAALVHHGGGTCPRRRPPVPVVLTVHDLQYRTYPQYFSRIKRAYLDAAVPRSVSVAAVVTVPSAYVRTTVVDAYGIDPARVRVVPHGLDPAELREVTPEAELRARYGLGGGPVFVYPAVTHPHKNHALLLAMMSTHWRDPALRLVLTGGHGAAHATVAASADPRVRHLGRVPPADRNGLLAMAAAMVFPSQYEGFGAPVLEAMALGAPVVCADRAALPEVAGDAAVVLPLDPSAWADVPDIVASRRAALVAAGRRRAAGFTSLHSGTALADAYDLALA